ncbi:type II toxin-antitoxin system HipA family toxin [Rhodovastum atsumiense]|nr:HipA domain-containing protein [Rhodovastum atsumiense]
MPARVTLQIHLDNHWQDAATVEFAADAAGHRGATTLDYDTGYCFTHDPGMTGRVRGNAALSVRLPLSIEWRKLGHWPPFLMDLLPQGHARKVLADALRISPDSNACELPLLLRAGGGPIGNIRVKQAWDAEQARIAGMRQPGLTLEDVFALDERFLELAKEFAAIAAGSSGVQGAWPKVLLTQARDGLWYPDPLVPDDQARDHAIVKWPGDRHEATRLILAAEPPYLELARAFGLRCARPLTHRGNVLLIPRFDRRVEDGRVIRLGQESLVAAAGIAAFGHEAAHEDYLAVIREVCTDPATEVTEYVLRDLLNLALGNPDNHGRNTALQKDTDGTIRLTPLYDFCPMRLDATGVRRSTTWACMKAPGGPSRDLTPDWNTVCEVATAGVMDASQLRRTLAAKADILRALPDRARALGLDPQVIQRAMGRCPEMADAVAGLAHGAPHAAL